MMCWVSLVASMLEQGGTFYMVGSGWFGLSQGEWDVRNEFRNCINNVNELYTRKHELE